MRFSVLCLILLFLCGCNCNHNLLQSATEANNQLLRDHLSGLGVWITVTTVVFSILTVALPFLWNRKIRQGRRRIKQLEKAQQELHDKLERMYYQLEQDQQELRTQLDSDCKRLEQMQQEFYANSKKNEREIERLFNMGANLFMVQLVSKIQSVRYDNRDTNDSKNFLLMTFNVITNLPSCSKAVCLSFVHLLRNNFDHLVKQGQFGEVELRKWIFSTAEAIGKKFSFVQTALHTLRQMYPETWEDIEQLLKYFEEDVEKNESSK